MKKSDSPAISIGWKVSLRTQLDDHDTNSRFGRDGIWSTTEGC